MSEIFYRLVNKDGIKGPIIDASHIGVAALKEIRIYSHTSDCLFGQTASTKIRTYAYRDKGRTVDVFELEEE